MSNIGAQKQRDAQKAPEPTGPMWRGILCVQQGSGYAWVKVSIPQSVVLAHSIGDVRDPDSRGMVAAHMEHALMHDTFVTGQGWER